MSHFPKRSGCARGEPCELFKVWDRKLTVYYKLLRIMSKICLKVAKDLVARKDIDGTLNMRLNLFDVARVDISKNDYLTIASAQKVVL